MLQVSVETLRRWETDGRLTTVRSAGGQRLLVARVGAQSHDAQLRPAGPRGSKECCRAVFTPVVHADQLVVRADLVERGPHAGERLRKHGFLVEHRHDDAQHDDRSSDSD